MIDKLVSNMKVNNDKSSAFTIKYYKIMSIFCSPSSCAPQLDTNGSASVSNIQTFRGWQKDKPHSGQYLNSKDFVSFGQEHFAKNQKTQLYRCKMESLIAQGTILYCKLDDN